MISGPDAKSNRPSSVPWAYQFVWKSNAAGRIGNEYIFIFHCFNVQAQRHSYVLEG